MPPLTKKTKAKNLLFGFAVNPHAVFCHYFLYVPAQNVHQFKTVETLGFCVAIDIGYFHERSFLAISTHRNHARSGKVQRSSNDRKV